MLQHRPAPLMLMLRVALVAVEGHVKQVVLAVSLRLWYGKKRDLRWQRQALPMVQPV